jgi:hypothetical protein
MKSWKANCNLPVFSLLPESYPFQAEPSERVKPHKSHEIQNILWHEISITDPSEKNKWEGKSIGAGY